MIKKILYGVLGVVGVVVLASAVLAVLVMLNRLPVMLVSRLPLVQTHTVEGDVRMTDGESLPTASVTVEVKSAKGRTLKAKATEKNNYRYSVTFMGFGSPLSGDSVHIRALMESANLPPTDIATTSTVAQAGPAPAGKTDAKSKGNKNYRLLADYDAALSGASGGSESQVFTDLRLRTNDLAQPASLEAWKDVPLATLANLPDLPLDGTISLIAEVQPFNYQPEDAPFHLELPAATNEAELRAMPLSAMGEEIGRQTVGWRKDRTNIPLRYRLTRAASASIQMTDSRGNVVRNQRLGIPGDGSYPKALTWDWDGRDNSGAYVPEGEYTFIASADSLDLGNEPRGFIGNISTSGAKRVRYAEFTNQSVIGDLLDAYGLTVKSNGGRRGAPMLTLNESLSVFVAHDGGKPSSTEQAFKGEDTVGKLAEAFGLELDGVARGSTKEGGYRLTVRGGELRGKVVPSEMRPAVAVKSLEEFLRLPLKQVNVLKEAGRTVRFISGATAELNVVREQTRREVEEWERPLRETTPLTFSGEDTVQDLLDQINGVSGVTAKLQPPAGGERYQYDARIAGPNGSRIRFFRPGGDDATEGHLTANIRAAGLIAEARTEGLLKPVLGDGKTVVPIQVTAVGMDGKPLERDELTASASKGTFGNGGYLQKAGEMFEVAYTTPAITDNETVTITVVSQSLRKHEGGANATVPVKATVDLELAGVKTAMTPGSPLASAPTEGSAEETTLPPEEESQQTLTEPADSDTVAGSVTETAGGVDPGKMAKIYSKMSPAQAAELLLALPKNQALAVVKVLKDRDAAKIFNAALSAEEESEDTGDATTAMERRRKKQQLVELISGSH